MTSLPDAPVVLFDGVCNFCNGAVNFLIDRDAQQKFRFTAFQSEIGQQLLQDFGYTQMPESVMLVHKGKSYTSSTAVLKIAQQMSGLWRLAYVFILVPPFLRDPIYDFIARNRYKWFGKRDACRIPTPDVRARFLA